MIRATSNGLPGRMISICFAAVLSATLLPAWGDPVAGEPTPPEIQKGIQAALQARASALYGEKNDKGESYKRGYYSRLFKKLDGGTYTAGFKVDTAFANHMVTERYTYSLKQQPDGAWKITGEKLEDTYKGLYRVAYEKRECFAFDTFAFKREGLEITASKGSLCQSYLNEQPYGMGLAGAQLSYSYAPPVDQSSWLYKLLRKEKGADLVFDPRYVLALCDAASCQQIREKAFTGLKPIGYEQVHQNLKDGIAELDDAIEDGMRDNPFFGFRLPFEADHTYWVISIRKSGPTEHWLRVAFDSYEPREVAVLVSGVLGPLYRYHGEQTRASGANPFDLEYRPDADARDFEITSVKGEVSLGFDIGETLTGDVTFGMNTKREIREIPFAIARVRQGDTNTESKNPQLTINTLQDGEGNEMTWVRTGASAGLVILPKPVPAGTPLTMRMQFENRDSIYKLTPTFSFVDRGGWLPFVRFADLINEFDLTIRVPSKYQTLGIGTKVSEEIKDGASITRWVADNPVSFPTIIYGIYQDEKAGFPAKKLDGTPIEVTIHVDKDSMGRWQIAPRSLRKFADDAANSLNLYAKIFGVDYPYTKLDLVNDAFGGFYGQAPSSIIYLGSNAFISKGLTGSFAGGSSTSINEFQDSLVAHEVAHQWWGSVVANSNFHNYWFIESLAEYSSALFMENVYGRKVYENKVEAWREEILENDIRSGVQDSYTVWAGPGGFGPYRANLYAKGPYAFHIMRSTWGDEAFFKFLKNLAAETKGKEIVTRDIQRVAEKSFGANLDWFFDQWLRGVGLPEFTFTYNVRPAEDGKQYVIEGEISQRILMKPAMAVKEEMEGRFFKGMVPITVVGKSGKEYRKRVLIETAKVPFKFNVPEQPKEVVFNKHGESLGYDVKVVETSSM